MKITKSSITLLIANVIPILGVAFWGWSLYEIMLCYWVENIVIGFYAILRIAKAKALNPDFKTIMTKAQQHNLKFGLIPFFILHYGSFTLGHGIAVYLLFGPKGISGEVADISYYPVLITFFSFLVSHGFSYLHNYIGKKEYLLVSSSQMMLIPYIRVAMTDLTVMLSGFVFGPLGGHASTRILVICIKTILDYFHHSIRHKKLMEFQQANLKNI
jgi:hypothetical protein